MSINARFYCMKNFFFKFYFHQEWKDNAYLRGIIEEQMKVEKTRLDLMIPGYKFKFVLDGKKELTD